MQALEQQFRSRVVSAGSLRGHRYGEVELEALRRAAKRYASDPAFHQYARAKTALQHLTAHQSPRAAPAVLDDDPVPCRPLPNPNPTSRRSRCCGCGCAVQLSRVRKVQLALALGCCVLTFRPAFGLQLSKLLALCIRVAVRHSSALLTTVFDELLEEALAQMDSALRPPAWAVPSDGTCPVQQLGVSTFTHVLGNVVSATSGAVIALCARALKARLRVAA